MAWAEREAKREGVTISHLVTTALAHLRDERLAQRKRDAAWAEWMAEFEAEHGAITREEREEAARELGLGVE